MVSGIDTPPYCRDDSEDPGRGLGGGTSSARG